jgi:DNA helicase IV
MRGIVATFQAEQDEIIRLDHPEVLVIEGGRAPGGPWWRCTASLC